MLKNINRALIILGNFGRILIRGNTSQSRNPFALLVTYLQILSGLKSTFLGITFNSFTRHERISNFEEIFVANAYYFETTNETPFIIDGGANLGEELLYFHLLYPKAQIIAFEPGKEVFRLLQKNISDNRLRKTTAYPYALSDKPGSRKFYIEHGNPGAASMSLYPQRLNKGTTRTRAVKLSTYIDNEVDFLKLDIEGEELAVIKELEKAKKLKLIKQFVVEYHHHIGPRDDKLSLLLKILERNGFGYQISTPLKTPFEKNLFQDLLIFGYRQGRDSNVVG